MTLTSTRPSIPTYATELNDQIMNAVQFFQETASVTPLVLPRWQSNICQRLIIHLCIHLAFVCGTQRA